jgi:hypothetical protein
MSSNRSAEESRAMQNGETRSSLVRMPEAEHSKVYPENTLLIQLFTERSSLGLSFCLLDSDSPTDPVSDAGFFTWGVGSRRFFRAGANRAVRLPAEAAMPPPAGPACPRSSSALAAECDDEVTSSSRMMCRTRRTMLPMASSARNEVAVSLTRCEAVRVHNCLDDTVSISNEWHF